MLVAAEVTDFTKLS